MKTEPFNRESKRLELLCRLNEIPGIDLPTSRINKRPSFLLSVLKDEAVLRQFLEVLNWFVQEVEARKFRECKRCLHMTAYINGQYVKAFYGEEEALQREVLASW